MVRDLTGWDGLNPHSVATLTGEKKEANLAEQRADFPKHWTVENGELVNDGHGPYATTDADLGDIDFDLAVFNKALTDAEVRQLYGLPQARMN